MKARSVPVRGQLMALAGFVAVSAYGGAAALVTGWLRLSASMTASLPFHSRVFAGIALTCVVAVPATAVAVLAWRHHPRARDAATLAGVLLVGWIIVEVAVIRQFSALQVVYGLAGAGLVAGGRRRHAGRRPGAGLPFRRDPGGYAAVALTGSAPLSGKALIALLPLLVLLGGFIVYCLVDLIRAPSVRYLPKLAWALIIVLISAPFGALAYLVFGKDRHGRDASEPAGHADARQ